jgi:glutamate N-acetyltransferase / amino-acid N-acetyltransferase
VTALPKGWLASGIAAGLKPSGNPDVGILYSETPAVAVGTFTTNRFQAAPVVITRKHIRRGSARAIVVNAGNANACTGAQGLADATRMARIAAEALKIPGVAKILPSSTGVIGQLLDMTKLESGINGAAASLSADGADAFASAIMTTDTKRKIATATVGSSTVVGFAKGAGMMAPEMATMLVYIVSDAVVDRSLAQRALSEAVTPSFNALDLDGCMSTNDTVLLLANGASGHTPDADAFESAVAEVCASLARQIADDGEGMTKLITVRVGSAANAREARKAATAIARSALLKCALNGSDPYWGRVLAALGAAGIPFDPNVVDVWMGGQHLSHQGSFGPGDVEQARLALKEREVQIAVELNRGTESWTTLTNDLSAEYVAFNTEYTT